MKSYINILASADTSTIRTETMAGKEYTVVPCVALVEGVLQGANSPEPELALASEFGKIVDGWNGRPLVLNHPKINGNFVSANSPIVWQDWGMGWVFNAHVQDKKLKIEAWIDNARVAELGGEFVTIKDAIINGEMVEVSTGLFTDLINMHGIYQGEKYGKVWENIVPDHLAILSFGTIGACSIEDGCGIPRLNNGQAQLAQVSAAIPEMRIHMSALKQTNNTTDAPCSCQGGAGAGAPEAPAVNHRGVDKATHDALALFEAKVSEVQAINVNAYPSGMPDKNVRALLTAALKDDAHVVNEGGLWSIYMFTDSVVVYETWSVVKPVQRQFNIGADLKVELIGEPQDVVILSQIVPVTNSDAKPGDAGVKGNADVTTKEIQMTDVKKETEAGAGVQANQAPASEANQPGAGSALPGPEAKAPTALEAQEKEGKQTAKLTTQQYIDQAPDEVKAVLNSAITQRNNNRAKLISAITANKTNVFAEAELKDMSDDMLTKLATLAGKTVDYSGLSPAEIVANTDASAVPAAPKVFTKKAG